MSKEIRQKLLWEATKARKMNHIDQSSFEKIKILVKEPESSNQKIQQFFEAFTQKMKLQQQPTMVMKKNDSIITSFQRSGLELLPSVTLQIICSYVLINDVFRFAMTNHSINSGIFPLENWPRTILVHYLKLKEQQAAVPLPVQQQEAEMEEEEEDVVEQQQQKQTITTMSKEEMILIQKIQEDFSNRDLSPLRFFARGIYFLSIATSFNELKTQLLEWFLMSRMNSLHLKLEVVLSIASKGPVTSGTPLRFNEFKAEGQFMSLRFGVTEIPAIIYEQTGLNLLALEGDGRSITSVSRYRRIGQKNFVQIGEGARSGKGEAQLTTAGERSVRWLGHMVHNDEYYYQRELSTTGTGGHGMGSWEAQGISEVIIRQDNKMAFVPPAGCFEVGRLGIAVTISLEELFIHCFCKGID